jgi:uncharacterized protein (TIGR03435 family)
VTLRTVLSSALTIAVLFSTVVTSAAQQRLLFDAASVKRSVSTERSAGPVEFQKTSVVAIGVGVSSLISAAYGVPTRDLVDAPQWIYYSPFTGGERYDVVAKAAEGSSSQDLRVMLQNLLADRFGLRTRRESRQLPVYILTKLDERGRLGPNLRPAAKTCQPLPTCEGRVGAGAAAYTGTQWSSVVQTIGNAVGDRLVDRTGLAGFFDYELTYTTASLSTTTANSGVDIFAAVRQQLGLKLEAGRAPFDVTVVEAVNRPTPN